MTSDALRAPFPWFGGKRKVAQTVWERLGGVKNYIEPFFGSGAVLLARPAGRQGVETVNDLDGLLVNFWRALQDDPETLIKHADWPGSELDLHARHPEVIARAKGLPERLRDDPRYYDVHLAGWWVWGICCWIGDGWGGRRSSGPRPGVMP